MTSATESGDRRGRVAPVSGAGGTRTREELRARRAHPPGAGRIDRDGAPIPVGRSTLHRPHRCQTCRTSASTPTRTGRRCAPTACTPLLPVGRIVLRLFEIRDPAAVALSDDVCIGLQLANFAQDVSVDKRLGRTYLLQSEHPRARDRRCDPGDVPSEARDAACIRDRVGNPRTTCGCACSLRSIASAARR